MQRLNISIETSMDEDAVMSNGKDASR